MFENLRQQQKSVVPHETCYMNLTEKFFENRNVQHTWKQKNLYGCTKHLIGARVALLGNASS